jgi:hypothetical protein
MTAAAQIVFLITPSTLTSVPRQVPAGFVPFIGFAAEKIARSTRIHAGKDRLLVEGLSGTLR